MLKETGICSGIENYSRYLSGLKPGEPPYTPMDYFGDDFLIIVDESHKTVPQIRSMYAGDQSRKSTLVDYGFRLPSAKDNRPLNFGEFEDRIDQILFVSATPGDYEADHELLRAEQIIRPTGLLDPDVEVRPVEGQIDDLISEVKKETEKHNKVLVTTLTKTYGRGSDRLYERGRHPRALPAPDIDTLERTEIIRDMRLDVFDVLVGINLLREGLDIRKSHSWRSWMPIKKVSCVPKPPDPDHRPCRAKQRGPCYHVCRCDDRFHAPRDRRDEAPPCPAGSLQQRTRHHSDHHQKSRPRSHQHFERSGKDGRKMEKDPESMSREELEKLIGQGTETDESRCRRTQLRNGRRAA